MNKISIILCVLCVLCASCSESSQVNYIIKGTVHGINGKKVYLKVEENNKAVDSATVINNSFTFKGCQPKACFATIYVSHVATPLILENGTINAFFDNSRKITGTKLNDIFNTCYEKTINDFFDKFLALRKRLHQLKEDQEDEITALKKKWKEVTDKQVAIAKECIIQNSNNIVGAYFLKMFEDHLSCEEIDKILDSASPAMKEHCYTMKIIEHQKLVKRIAIGQKFTDFTLKDPNDREVSLSDYIGKGKYVLIDFWASWCGPCRGEMPNVKATYEKFKSKGFEIVGVSLDSKKEDWLKGIQDLCITWPQMSDLKGWKCEGAKTYDIKSIPSTLLIDPNGVIITKCLRGKDLENKLNEVLK